MLLRQHHSPLQLLNNRWNMQKTEFRAMSIEALETELASMRANLFKLEMEKGVSQLKDVSQIAKMRSAIAHALMVITEKKSS